MMWDVNDASLYNADHLVVKHQYDSDHVAVVWFGFIKGQTLRDHETTSTAIIQILKGRIRLSIGVEQTLESGQTVQLQPRERHALTALDNAVVQLVLVPHPRYHSLAKEIALSDRE